MLWKYRTRKWGKKKKERKKELINDRKICNIHDE
jgi:hypothetical protein